MIILEQRALRGPNRYSRYPAILLVLDIGEMEEKPSDTLPGFTKSLLKLLPSLDQHGCSIGTPGGFIERLQRGTWMGHIVEHVALELQCLSGIEVGFGKTFDTSRKGVYNIVYRYRVESAGLYAGKMAVELVASVIKNNFFDLKNVIKELKEMREREFLGPTTASIVNEAKSRGIPTMRLDKQSFVQLGYGKKQRRIIASMTDRTSALGVEIADEKFRTKEILSQAGIPVPYGEIVTTLEQAKEVSASMGYPVTVKPEVGNHGRGITTAILQEDELDVAFTAAAEVCPEVIIEKNLRGFDFRVLVIDGRFVAAAKREPAHIIGDGVSKIKKLIDTVNLDPHRGFGHEKILTQISIDAMTMRLLNISGYTLDTVLPVGKKVVLKTTANLSTGGTAHDLSDEVHADVRFMCERVARIIGLDCIGIDIVAPGIDKSLDPGVAGIVEVNAAPGFRMHLFPNEGKARNVAKPFVDMLFPPDKIFQVPVVAITGTNGKTTTAKIVAHSLNYSGNTVAFAGTTGVEIHGVSIASGDYSGPEGARMVLAEPSIDHAVLEVARGGVIRRGLGFDAADIGVILNVDEDHIGTEDVETIDDLAKVKSTVIEVVKETGYSILNADDPIVVSLSDRSKGKIIYFSINSNHPVIARHLEKGGTAVVLENGNVVIRSTEPDIIILPIIDAPITFGGVVTFNIANVLAAAAALFGLGTKVEAIRKGISTFHPSATQNPGRMNLIDFKNFKVIVDYGHNVPAIRALGRVLPNLTTGRKLVVAHGTGNRTDAFIKKFGTALADIYDHIIIADPDPRNRELGVTPEIVQAGIFEAGFAKNQVEIVIDLFKATDRAFEIVQPGDLIVIQVDEVKPILTHVMQHFERIMSKK